MMDPIGPGPVPAQGHATIKTAARALEATFLARMLDAAGAGRGAQTLGGGIGESQFASFLLDAQAQRLAERGGIGLAEMIVRHYAPQDAGDAP